LKLRPRWRREPPDPYWADFINRPPGDPNNLLTHAFGRVPEGGTNPVRSEVHSPNVMAGHVKEFGRFLGAEQVGIVRLVVNPFAEEGATDETRCFAIVCVLKADHDTATAGGIGGQTPALKGLFATFNLAAYIKELGYRATRSGAHRQRLAALAGLGVLDAEGRLSSARLGPNVHVAEVVYTDLPLEADGWESLA
jgi:hypothetical protein